MQVERHADRNSRTRPLPDPPEKLSFPVGQVRRHHGAVEAEKNGVERPVTVDRIDDFAGDGLETVFGDRTGRRCVCEHRRHHLPLPGPRELKVGGDLGAGVGSHGLDLVAAMQRSRGVCGKIGRQPAERIGFVLEAGDQDATTHDDE